ncbi:pumilio and CPL domain-containing protein penguin [Ptiloglossa arizonensis]|uniref:pumilio and CPL domain-containing protein penguin n=1 Tax=Ptiloglossa arizonensis TaxID=3350558 RepID=UPI003F9EDA71
MAKRNINTDNELKVKKNKSINVNNDMNDDAKYTVDDQSQIKKKKREMYKKVVINVDKENHKHVTNGIKDKYNVMKAINGNNMQKPNWFEIKKQKKELKEKYKAKKLTNIYDIAIKVKHIGEKLRRSDCTKLERKKLILQTHELLQSHYSKVILTHDMSRIIQWMFKYSDSKIRIAIFNELKPSLLTMIPSKYAKNCVKSMLKYGSPEIRHEIISSCYGTVVKFMSHSVSAPLLEIMYTTWATYIEKIFFKQEFYGDMYKQAKDKEVKTLSDVFKNAENMKSATLSAVKGNLMRILNKKLLHFTLVQCVILEFLNDCTVEDRTEIIVMLRDSVVELSQTKPGSKIVIMCIWHGTNKDRKIIMKALKEHVTTISMSEHGYLILLALFDSVDDTVLVKKIILSEIQKHLTDIALNEYGKHVILYLIARRNSFYFPPSIVTYLQQGDSNETSKKPANLREEELLHSISDSLLEAVTLDTAIWMSNSSIAMVTLAILKVGTGEKLKQAFKSIATFITDSTVRIKEKDLEHRTVEHAGLHMMLKKVIQNDKELLIKGETTFGDELINHLEADVIEQWIEYNRGCFLLVLLLENETKSTSNTLLSKLKPMMSILKSKSNPGASILLKKLS